MMKKKISSKLIKTFFTLIKFTFLYYKGCILLLFEKYESPKSSIFISRMMLFLPFIVILVQWVFRMYKNC